MAYMNTGRETVPESREDLFIELRAGGAIWMRVARGVSPVVAPRSAVRPGHRGAAIPVAADSSIVA